MSLFAVNRYHEDENDTNDGIDYEDNLSRLKARIEERRKAKRTAVSLENEPDNERLGDTSPNKRLNEDDSGEINLEQRSEIKIDIKSDSRTEFKILGVREFEKKLKVKRVLPYWLSHPTTLSVDLKNHNCEIRNIPFLDISLKKKLIAESVEYLFPVQAKVIPWLLEENKKSEAFWPRDLCVSAPTGSGKTLAYVLPIVQILSSRVERQIRTLVVLPVKELATQVAKVFKDYCVGTNLKVALITGQISFQQEQSLLVRYSSLGSWQSEVDIMVCTAGRLVEHLKSTNGFTLQHLRFLVIDEADRIMQHIQNDWLYHLNQHVEFEESIVTGKAPTLCMSTINTVKRPPQKLFFSATLSQDPEKLKEWGLFQPKLFSVTSKNSSNMEILLDNISKYSTPLELSEKYLVCDIEHKPAVLYELLTRGFKKVLCFTNSSQSAHRLAVLLKYMFNNDLIIAEISAALSKTSREAVLKRFKSGNINVLISTDALARGIDVVDCDSVISYDPPKNVKTYIHRVGRTGRAGRQGTAFAILTNTQLKLFKDILKISGKLDVEKIEVNVDHLQQTIEIYLSALAKSKDDIFKETSDRVSKLKILKRGRSISTFKKKK